MRNSVKVIQWKLFNGSNLMEAVQVGEINSRESARCMSGISSRLRDFVKRIKRKSITLRSLRK